MKILYIGSRTENSHSLTLEREITELQRRFVEEATTPVELVFLPDTSIEDFADDILCNKPDVLHISSHGESNALELVDRRGQPRELTADDLDSALSIKNPPRLVYLNACNSHLLADRITRRVAMAIGTSASIQNGAARAGALRFYDRVLRGQSVLEAFEASRKQIELIQPNCSSHLARADGIVVDREILHPVTQIVAKILDQWNAGGKKVYKVKIGLANCSKGIGQCVIFTDDDDFARLPGTLENNLCWVIRDKPIDGLLWSEGSWEYYGDFPMFASAVTSSGRLVTANATLCQALRAWAEIKGFKGEKLEKVMKAENQLLLYNGGN